MPLSDNISRKRSASGRRNTILIDDVFDNSTMAVFILDKDFHIVWLNETTEVYFGIDRDTAIGMDNRGLILNTMRHIFDDPDHFVDALFSGYERQAISNTFICHVLGTEDGTVQERWLEHSSKAISAGLYAGGRIEQYTDITEHVRIEVAEREQRALAEALSDTALALTSTLDLDEVLDRILENVQYVVPHDNAKILLINGAIARVVRTRGYKNFDPDDQPLGVQFKLLEEPHLRRMFESGAPVAIPDIHADPDWRLLPGDEWLHACISAPVRFQNQTIGYINLLCTEPDKLTPEHAKRLQLFAAQAAIAIQNARHHQQSRELVAVEERQRIARDLHDAVSQSLFSASVIAQSLLKNLARKSGESAATAQISG